MPQASGPKQSAKENLIFAYDIGDVKNSYVGEPTENILYSGGDTELNDGYTWTNSGTWTYSNDDTSVAKPYIPNVNTNSLLIMSGVTETVGSQQIGCAYYASLTPSTTYTISVWFRQNRAGSNQPYFRTNINNNSLGNFSYNGDTDASNWPINQWIRISATATIQSNENGAYLSNYIGSAVGDKVWYFAPQLEAKSHMTPVTTVVRSVTQGLLPLVGNTSIDLTNVSFDANAQMTFDGTNDYIAAGNPTAYRMGTSNFTLECVMKQSKTTGHCLLESRGDSLAGYLWVHNYSTSGRGCLFLNYGGSQYLYYQDGGYVATTTTQYYHMAIVVNRAGNTISFYVNGNTAGNDVAIHGNSISPTGGDIYRVGFDLGGSPWQGEIPIFKHYNRALTATEVQQNYKSYKTRFKLA